MAQFYRQLVLSAGTAIVGPMESLLESISNTSEELADFLDNDVDDAPSSATAALLSRRTVVSCHIMSWAVLSCTVLFLSYQ